MGAPSKGDKRIITYFTHPVNFRNMPQVVHIRDKFDARGWEAQCIFTAMLEDAAVNSGFLYVSQSTAFTSTSYARRIGSDAAFVAEVWAELATLEVIVIDENGIIKFTDIDLWFGPAIQRQNKLVEDAQRKAKKKVETSTPEPIPATVKSSIPDNTLSISFQNKSQAEQVAIMEAIAPHVDGAELGINYIDHNREYTPSAFVHPDDNEEYLLSLANDSQL